MFMLECLAVGLLYLAFGHMFGVVKDATYKDETPTDHLTFWARIKRGLLFPVSYFTWESRGEDGNLTHSLDMELLHQDRGAYLRFMTFLWPISLVPSVLATIPLLRYIVKGINLGFQFFSPYSHQQVPPRRISATFSEFLRAEIVEPTRAVVETVTKLSVVAESIERDLQDLRRISDSCSPGSPIAIQCQTLKVALAIRKNATLDSIAHLQRLATALGEQEKALTDQIVLLDICERNREDPNISQQYDRALQTAQNVMAACRLIISQATSAQHSQLVALDVDVDTLAAHEDAANQQSDGIANEVLAERMRAAGLATSPSALALEPVKIKI